VDRKIRVMGLNQRPFIITQLGAQGLDKKSYQVEISESSKSVVVEARITLGTLEVASEPEKRIEEWFATRPLPQTNTVVEIPAL
jgi:hypothetical protein